MDTTKKRDIDEVNGTEVTAPPAKRSETAPAKDTGGIVTSEDATIGDKEEEPSRSDHIEEDFESNLDGPDNAKTEEDMKQQKEEKRMEINRKRAKEIRKRKKKQVEDMQKQIIHLTLENNKLRTQAQMQQAEINLLRQSAMAGPIQQHKMDPLGHQAFNTNDYNDAMARGIPQSSLLPGLNNNANQSMPSNHNLGMMGGDASLLSRAHGLLGSQNGGQNMQNFQNVPSSSMLGLSDPSRSCLGGTNGAISAVQNDQMANAFVAQQHDMNLQHQIRNNGNIHNTSNSEEQALLNHSQRISTLLAGAPADLRSGLLQTLSQNESDRRILSMVLDQQNQGDIGS